MKDITNDSIKNLIINEFFNKEFTIGDIFYSIVPKFNRSLFGTIRNIIVKLSKENFLSYTIRERGMPHLDSEKIIRGAVYRLKK